MSGDVPSLVDWLTAQLDEDERVARAMIDDDGGQDGGFEDSAATLTWHWHNPQPNRFGEAAAPRGTARGHTPRHGVRGPARLPAGVAPMSGSVHVTDEAWEPAPAVPDGKCSGCYGWGYPLFPWRGKVCMKLDARCPQCGGSGEGAQLDSEAAGGAQG